MFRMHKVTPMWLCLVLIIVIIVQCDAFLLPAVRSKAAVKGRGVVPMTRLPARLGGGVPAAKVKNNCKSCNGSGNIKCDNLTCINGIDKKNGNVFERWKCKKCHGFGFLACPCTGSAGLTPEQRGER